MPSVVLQSAVSTNSASAEDDIRTLNCTQRSGLPAFLAALHEGRRLGRAYQLLKDYGFEVGRAGACTRGILKKLIETASKPGIFASPEDSADVLREFTPLIVSALSNSDCSRVATQTIKSLITRIPKGHPAKVQAFRLARVGLRSPYSCDECIKIIAKAAVSTSADLNRKATSLIHSLLGPESPWKDDRTTNEILASYIIKRIFSLGGSAARRAKEHFAELVWNIRESFLSDSSTSYLRPRALLANAGIYKAAGADLMDGLEFETDSYTNQFPILAIESLCWLPAEKRTELRDVIKDSIKMAIDESEWHPLIANDHRRGREMAELILEAYNFGTPEFRGFPDGLNRFYLLTGEGGKLFMERLQNTSVPRSIAAFSSVVKVDWGCDERMNEGTHQAASLLLERCRREFDDLEVLAQVLEPLIVGYRGFLEKELESSGYSLEQNDQRLLCAFRDSMCALIEERPQLITRLPIVLRVEAAMAAMLGEKPRLKAVRNPDTAKDKDQTIPDTAEEKSQPNCGASILDPLERIRREADAAIEEFFLEPAPGTGQKVQKMSYLLQDFFNKTGMESSEFSRSPAFPLLAQRLAELGLPQLWASRDWKNEPTGLLGKWKKGAGHLGLGWLVGAQLEMIKKLESRRPGSCRHLYEEYGILNFARYPFPTLIAQVCEPPSRYSKLKPIHLFFSRVDHNGGFYQSAKIAHLACSSPLPLLVHEFSSPESLTRRLLRSRSRFGPIRNFGLLAHGMEEAIEAYTTLTVRHIWSLEASRLVRSVFADRVHIFFSSCRSGDTNGVADALAQKLRGKAFTITAGTGVHSTSALDFSSARGFSIESDQEVLKYYGYRNGRVRRVITQATAGVTGAAADEP